MERVVSPSSLEFDSMPATVTSMHLVDGLAVIELNSCPVFNQPVEFCLEQRLLELVAGVLPKGIIVDVKNVDFISAELVAALLNLRRLADQGASDIVLAHLRPDLRRIFRARRLDKLFRLHDSLAGAINQLLMSDSKSQPAA